MWVAICLAISIASLVVGASAMRKALSAAARSAEALAACSVLRETFAQSPSESLRQRVTELEATMEVLSTSVRMSKVRRVGVEKQENHNGMPDPYKDPDAWRSAANARLGQSRFPV